MDSNPIEKNASKKLGCEENHQHFHKNEAKNGEKRVINVTVFCGLESSGKTTVINSILNEREEKIGVIMNNMKKKNAISDLSINKDKHQIVSLPKGCACCTLYDEFIQSFKIFKGSKSVDRILVEATAVAEVIQMGETISFGDQDECGTLLSRDFNLDAIVTLVDVSNFFKNLNSLEYLADLKCNTDEEDFRNLPSVLIEQIEHADLLILTKFESVPEEELRKVKEFVRLLNPTTTIFQSNNGDLSPDQLLDTQLYDFEKTQMKPGWLKIMREEFKENEDSSEFGHFTFRSRRPFHPARLWDLIDKSDQLLPGVLRSRGFSWMASRNDMCGEWTSSGNLYSLQASSRWFTLLPKESWPKDDPKFLQDFVEPYGDRRQEIVFMGMNLKEEELRGELERCLLTLEEMEGGEEEWKKMEDRFGPWDLDELDSADYGNDEEEEGDE